MRLLWTILLGINCFIAPVSSAQTVALRYTSAKSPTSRLIYLYNTATHDFVRIQSTGKILLINSKGESFVGESGISSLKPGRTYDRAAVTRMAATVLPHLIVQGIENDALAKEIHKAGPLGGSTYEGLYPQGKRLLPLSHFPDPSNVRIEKAMFDLDGSGRLGRIRYPDSNREEQFDHADASTASLSFVKSFADGGWVLIDAQIYDKSRPELFDQSNVIKYAREEAFASAKELLEAQSQQVTTPSGRKEMEKLRSKVHEDSFSQSTKRFALILTGLIVIAVGSLAWWKNRS